MYKLQHVQANFFQTLDWCPYKKVVHGMEDRLVATVEDEIPPREA